MDLHSVKLFKNKGKTMNLQDFQGMSPEEIKNIAAYMMLASYAPIFSTLIVIFISYVLRAYALSKISTKLHFEHPNVAWIPFGHGYVEGYICDFLSLIRLICASITLCST